MCIRDRSCNGAVHARLICVVFCLFGVAMETERKLRLADVFVTISDPRQAGKVEHDLVELLVVAVNAVLVGADTFVEIELWAQERLDWLRGHLRLENGIPSVSYTHLRAHETVLDLVCRLLLEKKKKTLSLIHI